VLSQCLQLFGFFALVLVLVYWINQAVILFDRLIADGQTALVFLEFTALTLPNIIRIVLPIAAFAAVMYVTNRMNSDSEIAVMQATGHSAQRMARPVVIFGLLAGVMMAVLMHVLVPISQERFGMRQAEVSQNVTGRLLREGVFTHPGSGSTLYLRDITADGQLLDVFLADAVPGRQDQIFTAERAFLVRTENGPRLVLIDGQFQTLDVDAGTLFVTNFEDFTLDLGALVDEQNNRRPNLRELSTYDLLFPTPELVSLTRKSLGEFTQEAHDRIAQPLLPLTAALIGFAVLIAGGFSRFGSWRQVVAAVVILIFIKGLEGMLADQVIQSPDRWPLTYVPPFLGIVLAWSALLYADRTRRRPRSPDDMEAGA